MRRQAVKVFEVEESSVEGGHYEIVLKRNGEVVDRYHRERMDEAQAAFVRDGYQRQQYFIDHLIESLANKIGAKKDEFVSASDYEKAAELRDELEALKNARSAIVRCTAIADRL